MDIPTIRRPFWRPKRNGPLVAMAAAGLSLAGLVACSGSNTTHADATPKVGQVAGYSPTNANEEGYWYSRYNMMSLTMQSGLGETFMPSSTDMQMAMAAAAQNPADPAMPPVNPALISAVYAGGDPHYVTAPNAADFATLRWKGGPASFSTLATAWTMIKELEWAKMFHVDPHFGTPTSSFGATQRFAGMMFAPMVKMQNMDLQQNGGRYAQSRLGDYALLLAYSDAAGFYGAATMPHSTTNRYADSTAAGMFHTQAQQQFQKVIAESPVGIQEASSAIQSVVWYASITTDPAELASARTAILQWANGIANSLGADPSPSPATKAYAIVGLIEAGRVTGVSAYLDQAATTTTDLLKNFDAVHGVVQGTSQLSTDNIGEIAAAFNTSGLFLGTRIDQAALNNAFGAWWEGTVNLSGFMIAAPDIPEFKGTYETTQDPLNLRYPSLPLPENAGSTYGSAPVFSAKITWTGDGWTADHTWFDTAGAMHASTEFMWFHNDEVNGFPAVSLP